MFSSTGYSHPLYENVGNRLSRKFAIDSNPRTRIFSPARPGAFVGPNIPVHILAGIESNLYLYWWAKVCNMVEEAQFQSYSSAVNTRMAEVFVQNRF